MCLQLKLSVNWNCPDNCFGRLPINWSCPVIEAVQTTDFGDCPLVGIVQTNGLVCCLLIWFVWTFDFLALPIKWNCPNKWFRVLSIKCHRPNGNRLLESSRRCPHYSFRYRPKNQSLEKCHGLVPIYCILIDTPHWIDTTRKMAEKYVADDWVHRELPDPVVKAILAWFCSVLTKSTVALHVAACFKTIEPSQTRLYE